MNTLRYNSVRRPVAAVVAVLLGGTACSANNQAPGPSLAETPTVHTPASAETQTIAPPPTTSKVFKAIIGTIAETQNAQGVAEGTYAYKGAADTEEARQRAVPDVLPEGATVHVECLEKDGREVRLTEQSPHLGIASTDDWLRVQELPGGSGPAWIPDVFVATPKDVSIPEC